MKAAGPLFFLSADLAIGKGAIMVNNCNILTENPLFRWCF